jgi:hypothetical protein
MGYMSSATTEGEAEWHKKTNISAWSEIKDDILQEKLNLQ